MSTIIKPMLFILLFLRWEFIKEIKKVRKQENKNSTKKASFCFLNFLFSYFPVFFYKFPPQYVLTAQVFSHIYRKNRSGNIFRAPCICKHSLPERQHYFIYAQCTNIHFGTPFPVFFCVLFSLRKKFLFKSIS